MYFQTCFEKVGIKLSVQIGFRIFNFLRYQLTCVLQTEILDGLLRIDDVELEDEGQYECIATNKAGSASAVGFLRVQGKRKLKIPVQSL